MEFIGVFRSFQDIMLGLLSPGSAEANDGWSGNWNTYL